MSLIAEFSRVSSACSIRLFLARNCEARSGDATPGKSRRTADPKLLARLCGSSATLESVGQRMRCLKCGTKGAEVVAISVPRPRGRGFLR